MHKSLVICPRLTGGIRCSYGSRSLALTDNNTTFAFMQSKCSPATEDANVVGASSAEVSGCQTCGKTPDAAEFTKSQKKRLRLGKKATCKGCASSTKQLEQVIPPGISASNKREKRAYRTEIHMAAH